MSAYSGCFLLRNFYQKGLQRNIHLRFKLFFLIWNTATLARIALIWSSTLASRPWRP